MFLLAIADRIDHFATDDQIIKTGPMRALSSQSVGHQTTVNAEQRQFLSWQCAAWKTPAV
jgi:hypothetical protein